MRILLPLLTLSLLVFWGWLAVSGSAILVWQSKRAVILRCHYITALDLVEAQYYHEEGNPLGRQNCPLVIGGPAER